MSNNSLPAAPTRPAEPNRPAEPTGAAQPAEPAGAAEPAEPTLLYMMKQVELAVRARLEDIFRPISLTAVQYTALTVLERHPNMSSAQLARNSFVTAQTMADMITTLRGRALIARRRDPDDQRRFVLELTADGQRLLDRYRAEVSALEAAMLAGLTPAQAADLRVILRACRNNLAHPLPR
ncbi:MAG: MarR family winged helix-turn-helix transcriptional regulator [Frankia sp.]